MTISIDSKDYNLTDVQAANLANSIKKLFDKWDSHRAAQLEDYKFIRDALYKNCYNPQNDWRSNVSLPDIYELANTFKAHVWEDLLSKPDTMFDVTGKTPEANEYAPLQKAMLVNAFKCMNVHEQLEKALNYLTEAGEAVLFIGWETICKDFRRLNIPSSPKFEVKNKVVYDGAKVKAISPEDFVFDISQKDNWDSCPKIYRARFSADEILSNSSFKISPELKDYISQKKYILPPSSSFASCSSGFETTFEVLEYWGNFSLEDGSVLRNSLVSVVDGHYIVRFEPNPFVINPFVYSSLIEDPETKRGISPLRVAIVLNKISSGILNRQVDALSLVTNPPYLAPKGAFNGNQEVSPGKIIEYDTSLLPQMPTPLSFSSALQGWEFIDFFKQSIESSTGIFKNMSGHTNADMRTATEINHTVDGQSIRLNMAIDGIFRKLIMPMVASVADLMANFMLGTQEIPVSIKGKVVFVQVHEGVRQAEYSYVYGDKHSATQKKLQFKELYEIISGFAKIPQVSQSINWIECFKYALEQYGIENSSLFVNE